EAGIDTRPLASSRSAKLDTNRSIEPPIAARRLLRHTLGRSMRGSARRRPGLPHPGAPTTPDAGIAPAFWEIMGYHGTTWASTEQGRPRAVWRRRRSTNH